MEKSTYIKLAKYSFGYFDPSSKEIDFSHNPLEGIELNKNEKQFLKNKNRLAFLKSKKNLSKKEQDELFKLNEWTKYCNKTKECISFEEFNSFYSKISKKLTNVLGKIKDKYHSQK